MNVTTKNGKQGVVEISKESQSAVVVVNGVRHVVAFVRDQKKIVVKNDLLLLPADLNKVRQELSKFIKKEDTSKKRRK